MNQLHARELIDRYLAGDIAEEERGELERLLLGSREARVLFWQVCGTHVALVEWGRAHWGLVAAQAPRPQRAVERLHDRMIAAGRVLGGDRTLALGLAGSVAAAMLVALALWAWSSSTPIAPIAASLVATLDHPATGVARVADSSDAVWEKPLSFAVGDPVFAGPLRLLRGIVQLRFASGATVTLNGPVDVEIVNKDRIFLRSGSVTPFVPPQAHGFTVVSPSGEVVDLGTEFSVGVDADGQTSVYVIDGEVDVASGHSRRSKPLRMTQGFAAKLLSPAQTAPSVVEEPIVIDHFDGEQASRSVAAAAAPLRWIDLDPTKPARIIDGSLVIPIDNRNSPDDPTARILLDHDFSRLVGRRSSIAFKAILPPIGSANFRRWLAFVIDSDSLPAAPPRVPLAYSSDAAAAVMVSPEWQAGLRIRGKTVHTPRIFQRDEEAVGPYQVLVTIDDSPEGRLRDGGATLSLMVNGGEVVSRQRFDLGESPRLGFHTFLPTIPRENIPTLGEGAALVNDFSVSVTVETDAEGTASGP
jgi:hypothetical protein